MDAPCPVVGLKLYHTVTMVKKANYSQLDENLLRRTEISFFGVQGAKGIFVLQKGTLF